MYIKIPKKKEQIWFSFCGLCAAKEAAARPGEPLPPVSLKLDNPPSQEDLRWYHSQPLPGRYRERHLEYGSASQELAIPLVVVERD